jgi:hypothetical protein
MMDTEFVVALRGWAQKASGACEDAYQRSSFDAPLSEFAQTMTTQLRDLFWLLTSRLGAERERLAAIVEEHLDGPGEADARSALARFDAAVGKDTGR